MTDGHSWDLLWVKADVIFREMRILHLTGPSPAGQAAPSGLLPRRASRVMLIMVHDGEVAR